MIRNFTTDCPLRSKEITELGIEKSQSGRISPNGSLLGARFRKITVNYYPVRDNSRFPLAGYQVIFYE